MNKRRQSEKAEKQEDDEEEEEEEDGAKLLEELVREAAGQEGDDWCNRDDDYDPAALSGFADRLRRISEEHPLLGKRELENAWKDVVVSYMNRFFGYLHDPERPGIIHRATSAASSGSAPPLLVRYPTARAFLRSFGVDREFGIQHALVWLEHPKRRRWLAVAPEDGRRRSAKLFPASAAKKAKKAATTTQQSSIDSFFSPVVVARGDKKQKQ